MSLSKSVSIGSYVYICLAVYAVREKCLYLANLSEGLLKSPTRSVRNLLLWLKNVWDIGTTWFVSHCAKFCFSLRCKYE